MTDLYIFLIAVVVVVVIGVYHYIRFMAEVLKDTGGKLSSLIRRRK